MFGYVVPDKPNMFIKDFTMYRAFYCGLCKTIGKKCSQSMRFFTNYDMTFFAALLHAVRGEQVEIRIKYAGYISRQEKDVEQYRKLQSRPLPPALDYNSIDSIRLEARQKLNAVKPINFGQAARISGVSPADITALMIYMETRWKEDKA